MDGAAPTLATMIFSNATTAYTIASGSGGSLTVGTIGSTGTITDLAGNHTISAAIELARDTSVNVSSSKNTLTLSGGISGSGQLLKTGAGQLLVTGANSYTGLTVVSSGTLSLNGNLSSTNVSVQSGATLKGVGTIGGAVTISADGTLSATLGGTLVLSQSLVSAGIVVANRSGLAVAGTFTNSGTLNMVGGLGVFHSAVVNNGAWITDPTTNIFAGELKVTSSGYVSASAGDVYVFNGDLINQSTQSNDWNTLNATPGSDSGSGTKFVFDGAGLTLTQRLNTIVLLLTDGFVGTPSPLTNGVQYISAYGDVTGFTNNFAIGELELTNTTLLLAQALSSSTTNALFVNDLFLSADSRLIISNDMRVYFVNSNTWGMSQITLLGNAQIHQLLIGTSLPLAIPEPNVLLMWIAGAVTLVAARRRRRR